MDVPLRLDNNGVMGMETAARSVVEDVFALCDRIRAHIQTNHKTPFTGGHVDLYSSPSRNNEAFHGRLDVQLKGRGQTRKEFGKPSTVVRVTDLRAYLQIGGCLYLVADIDPKQLGVSAIWYKLLTPFEPTRIMEGIPTTQQVVTVPLKRLETDCGFLENLLATGIDAQREDPDLKMRMRDLPGISSFHIVTTKDWDLDRSLSLTQSDDFSFAVKSSLELVRLPGEFLFLPDDYLPKERLITVTAGDISYNVRVQRLDPQTVRVELSDGLHREFAWRRFPHPVKDPLRGQRCLVPVNSLAGTGPARTSV